MIHDTDLPYVSIEWFRQAGYLQEANRLFFHPLGMALTIEVDEDGSGHLLGVSATSDPEGVVFSRLPDPAKARTVANELTTRAKARMGKLGYVVQPCEGEEPVDVIEAGGHLVEAFTEILAPTVGRYLAEIAGRRLYEELTRADSKSPYDLGDSLVKWILAR